MKIVFYIISIVIVISVIFLAALNTQTVFNFTVWEAKGANAVIYHASLVQVILGAFVAGILAGVFWAVAFYTPIQAKLKEYQRKLEKTSVQSSEESSKVEVLEAKIATLEKALQAAIENKEG
jgi:Protein of unknown function (DUF1049).